MRRSITCNRNHSPDWYKSGLTRRIHFGPLRHNRTVWPGGTTNSPLWIEKSDHRLHFFFFWFLKREYHLATCQTIISTCDLHHFVRFCSTFKTNLIAALCSISKVVTMQKILHILNAHYELLIWWLKKYGWLIKMCNCSVLKHKWLHLYVLQKIPQKVPELFINRHTVRARATVQSTKTLIKVSVHCNHLGLMKRQKREKIYHKNSCSVH